MPEMSPEQLIAIFMYGETLHRDAEMAAQVEAWDSDPLLGPLMRQEVRADAQALVHFYGAFAGYVARWLEVADAQGAGEGEAADADGERGVVRRQAPATRAGAPPSSGSRGRSLSRGSDGAGSGNRLPEPSAGPHEPFH